MVTSPSRGRPLGAPGPRHPAASESRHHRRCTCFRASFRTSFPLSAAYPHPSRQARLSKIGVRYILPSLACLCATFSRPHTPALDPPTTHTTPCPASSATLPASGRPTSTGPSAPSVQSGTQRAKASISGSASEPTPPTKAQGHPTHATGVT